MTKFTLPFKKITKKSVSEAGGKGASLGEMVKAGFSVPHGFVVLASTFDKYIDNTGINIEIKTALKKVNSKDMESVEEASEIIQHLIERTSLSLGIEKEILSEFKKLKAKFVAVRSSATAEDSKIDSWAGELESYLNTTEKTLLENVKKCWISLFTPRAIFYRFARKLEKQSISVAVVVQEMVESEISGVAFSVHPITKDHNQMIIEAGYGLGEAIVLGKITPDSYVVNKKSREILDINISNQDKMVVRKGEKGDIKDISVLNNKKGKQKLSNKEIVQLSNIVKNIEQHYGSPQDIEWAYRKGKFYIVQSRPITTL
jgi:pyruvate,water dikinase